MRLSALLLIPLLLACEHTRPGPANATGTEHTVAMQHPAASTDTGAIATASPATASPELIALQRGTMPVRALYVNRFAAQSSKKMHHLIGIADSTEINGLVIDIKDEFGLNFHSADPMLRSNAGGAPKVANLKALVDSIRAHGILPIARIVVFKDSVAARMNPSHVIRQADGSPWRDKKGITWVDPYSTAIWEYNFRVADEAVRMGFGEIQFDYIRFPEPYKSLPKQIFPDANGRSKADVLAEFLKEARARIGKSGIRTTADIFGLVTTVSGALEVGQEWEKLAPVTDVLLPMVYPSHYPHGSFGIPVPNASPYQVVFIAISRARQRDAKLGINIPEHVRPWLQAFTLGALHYGPEQIVAQKQAVYDAGYDGWTLWNPGSKYDEILPALSARFVSHKKQPAAPLPPGLHME